MAHGKSLTLRWMQRDHEIVPREKRERDRSLAGKKRIKARRGR